MFLDLTDDQKLLQKTVREFAEAEVKPLARELDETGHFPRDTFKKAAELGLTGIAFPDEFGGAGFDHVAYTIVIEEISRVCASTGVILSAVYMLWMVQRVYYGEVTNEENRHLPDLTPREWVVITPVIAMAIFMGVFPTFFLAPTAPAIDKLVQRVGQSEGHRVHAPAPAPALPETTPTPSPEASLVR